MPLVRDLREIAGELQAHPLARTNRTFAFLLEPVKKEVDRYAEHLGHFEQPARRNTIDAALVFVRLLIRDPDQIGELLLRQSEHDAALANARSHILVDVLGAAGRASRRLPSAW